jgi:hypothetical protein
MKIYIKKNLNLYDRGEYNHPFSSDWYFAGDIETYKELKKFCKRTFENVDLVKLKKEWNNFIYWGWIDGNRRTPLDDAERVLLLTYPINQEIKSNTTLF